MKTEKEHIKEVGDAAYWSAYDRAQIECRYDPRLVGLNKIRSAIAHEAALRATGFRDRPFNLPVSCGPMTGDMRAIIDEVLPRALTAAQGNQTGHR